MAISPDELVAEQRSEMRALFGALARLHGFSELPRADDDQDIVSLPELDSALATVQNAKHLPAPLRLELLMRGVQADHDSLLSSEQLQSLAVSLVDPDAPQGIAAGAAAQLLERLRRPKTGRQDPLGRSSFRDLAEPDSLVSSLVPELQWTSLFTLPRCSATQATTGSGAQALDITTDTITVKPIDDFRTIVDPLAWPDCWLQESFFKEMKRVSPAAPAVAPSIDRPDQGWRAAVLKTVDFGFGFEAPKLVHTPLDVVFFFNSPPRAGALAATAGCTYDLVGGDPGVRFGWDRKIVVDSGFLLVESIEFEGTAYARYRTEKRVRFASDTPDPGDVCSFWSLAAGLILQGC